MTELPAEPFPGHPRVIFMGTPDFAVPTLKALISRGHHVLAVVTQPDRPKGRGRKLTAPPVKELAMKHGIEVLQPEKASDELFCAQIRAKEPDLIVVVAFGQILKKKLLDIPGWGVINVHASLLPNLRGAAPIQWTILNDETKTGLTVIQMDEGMDTGPILFQEEIPVGKDETAGQLHDRLAVMAGDLMTKSLERMSGKIVKATPQDHNKATYAPKISKDLSIVDWKEEAAKVSARIRGMDPKPGAYTLCEGQEIKLFASTVIDRNQDEGSPGQVLRLKEECLVIGTGRGTVGIKELQYPGKNRLPAREFLRMFFADRYFGYDDAVYASCRLVEILAKGVKPLSALVADLPDTTVTPEIRVDLPDAIKFDVVKRVRDRFETYVKTKQGLGPEQCRVRELVTIDGVRAVFEDGWGLIRASNTQPALVLRFEATTPAKLDKIRAIVEGELADVRRELER